MVSCISSGLSHIARKRGVTFHRLPKKLFQQREWIKFTGRKREEIPAFAVLCSQHFEETDFKTTALKIFLKENAIPSRIVQRHKYTKHHQTTLTTSTATSHQPIDAEPVCITLEPTPSTSTAEIMDAQIPSPRTPKMDSTILLSTEENCPRKVKLKRQIRTLSRTHLQQSRKVRKLQKQLWWQKTNF